MNTIEALKKRKSIRAFLDKSVEKDKIVTILETAKLSPSGVNMQPFDMCVVSGNKKISIENKILQAFDNNQKEAMDYDYYPKEFKEPYKSRRREMGLLMYKTIGITKGDKEKQIEQWKKNYQAFNAPVVLYFFIDDSLGKGSYLDYGMFLQSIMLTATHLDLATCPMVSLAEYPSIVKEELNIPNNKLLLCGIALGYEDTNDPINSFKTNRIDLDEFVKFWD
jgi:nitroreductase